MAKAATTGSVADSKRGPNYKAGLSILRIDMPSKKERIAKLNGETQELWGRLGGYHVDKVGAKLFVKLDELEEEERASAWRSLVGLIRNSNWARLVPDLVDQMQGVSFDPRGDDFVRAGEGSEDGEEETEKAPEPAAEKPKRVSAAEAKAKAQSHLRAVPDPAPAPKSADPDADLAGE